MVDDIVSRKVQKAYIGACLRLFKG
jgi:hypothetical protein